MLGDRNVRQIIEKAFNKLYDDLSVKIDKTNNERIHASEASRCTRLSYYERKDPLAEDSSSKISILLNQGIRHGLSNLRAEYKVDGMTLETNADMILGDEFVLRFEVVPSLPSIPHPRHLLYLNACLFAFGKEEGILVYITPESKSAEFTVTKNNRMFQEIVRRARVLSTLLKESNVPIIEPCDLCLSCKYFERCYAREKIPSKGAGLSLEGLFRSGEDR